MTEILLKRRKDTIQSINQSVQRYYRIYNQPIYIDIEYTINQCIQWHRIYNQPIYTTIYNKQSTNLYNNTQYTINQSIQWYTIYNQPMYTTITKYNQPIYTTIYNIQSTNLCNDIQYTINQAIQRYKIAWKCPYQNIEIALVTWSYMYARFRGLYACLFYIKEHHSCCSLYK